MYFFYKKLFFIFFRHESIEICAVLVEKTATISLSLAQTMKWNGINSALRFESILFEKKNN